MTRQHLRTALLLTIATLSTAKMEAQDFETRFLDATLRLDYIYAGTSEDQAIYLSGMKTYEGWYGKRINMNSLPLQGNGTITVTNFVLGDTIYRHSFSTLFQE